MHLISHDLHTKADLVSCLLISPSYTAIDLSVHKAHSSFVCYTALIADSTSSAHPLLLLNIMMVQSPKMQIHTMVVLLLATMSIRADAAPRKLLKTGLATDDVMDLATQHQRILAELEEVHQLRERMLQEGESTVEKS